MHESSQEQSKMKPSIIQGLAPVNGAHISYELAGQGHPLVFVQGSGSLGIHTWDDQFLPFSSFYQVLRYDIRGRGKSSDPGQSYSTMDDLFGLLQYLGIKKAYFVELRGATVLKLLQKHGDLSDALVLVSLPFFLHQSKEEVLSEIMPNFLQLFEQFSPAYEAFAQKNISKGIKLLMQQIGLSLPIKHLSYYRKLHKYLSENSHIFSHLPTSPQEVSDSWVFPQEQFEQLMIPTLVLRDDQDGPAICETFTHLIQTIPNAQHHIIPRSGYATILENQKVFNQTVLQFLQSLEDGH